MKRDPGKNVRRAEAEAGVVAAIAAVAAAAATGAVVVVESGAVAAAAAGIVDFPSTKCLSAMADGHV
jgi:hypothetical protein